MLHPDITSAREHSSESCKDGRAVMSRCPFLMKKSLKLLPLLQADKASVTFLCLLTPLFFNLALSHLVIVAVCLLKMTVLSKGRPLAVVLSPPRPCCRSQRGEGNRQNSLLFSRWQVINSYSNWTLHCPSCFVFCLCPIPKSIRT